MHMSSFVRGPCSDIHLDSQGPQHTKKKVERKSVMILVGEKKCSIFFGLAVDIINFSSGTCPETGYIRISHCYQVLVSGNAVGHPVIFGGPIAISVLQVKCMMLQDFFQ